MGRAWAPSPDSPASIALRVALLGAALLLAALTVAVQTNFAVPGDDLLLHAAHRYLRHRPGEVTFWRTLSTALGPLTWDVAAGAVAVWQLARRRWTAALLIGIAMLGNGLLSTGVKIAISRPRPEFADPLAHAAGYSFPSGHAQTSAVALGLVVVFLTRRVGDARLRRAAVAVCVLVGAAVGISRVLLGVHYPSDVVAGWIIAFIWVQSVLRAGTVHAPRSRRPT